MNKDPGNNDHTNDSSFGLPDGYFRQSAGSIMNKIEWIEEHKEFPHLSSLKKESGFVVPGDYFDQSDFRLELLGYPNLLKHTKDTGFSVPADYFEEGEVRELAAVVGDEDERTLFPHLYTVKKEDSFEVPENYFEGTEQRIFNRIHTPGRVISLFSGRIWYSAAAAVIAVVLGLWIYNYYFKPVAAGDCGTLACVDKNDLIKSRNLENLDDEQLYEIVDTKKLEEKLEEKESKENKSEKKDVDTSLKSISTDDLLDEI